MTDNKRMPAILLIERVLSVITVLGIVCLGIGILLYIIGRVSDAFIVAQVGAYILLIGIALVGMRVIYWMMVKIAERG